MYITIHNMLQEGRSPVFVYEAMGRKVSLQQIEQINMDIQEYINADSEGTFPKTMQS